MMSFTPEIQMAAKEVYNKLSNYANGYRHYGKVLGIFMLRDHKLLQAYVVGLFLDCIRAMAGQDDATVTMQNKNAVKLCRQIVECIGEFPQHL